MAKSYFMETRSLHRKWSGFKAILTFSVRQWSWCATSKSPCMKVEKALERYSNWRKWKEKKIREAYKFHFNFLLECLQIYFNAPPALYQGGKKCNLSLLVCISPWFCSTHPPFFAIFTEASGCTEVEKFTWPHSDSEGIIMSIWLWQCSVSYRGLYLSPMEI